MNNAEKQRLQRINGIMNEVSQTLLWLVLAIMVLGIAVRIILWAKGIKI